MMLKIVNTVLNNFDDRKTVWIVMGSVGTLCYESGISVNSYHTISVIDSTECTNVYYSQLCM